LTFLGRPAQVASTNNACQQALRHAVGQRKATNGYRAMWAAAGEAAVRTVIDTARLTLDGTMFGTILVAVSA
jgi:transposase